MCAKVQESACARLLFKETVSTSGNRGILFVSCTHCSADYPPLPPLLHHTHLHTKHRPHVTIAIGWRPKTCTHQSKGCALISCLTLNTLSLHNTAIASNEGCVWPVYPTPCIVPPTLLMSISFHQKNGQHLILPYLLLDSSFTNFSYR